MELEPDRKLPPDHLPSIFHSVLVGAGSWWPYFPYTVVFTDFTQFYNAHLHNARV
jgi:hypothetical protein